MKTPQSEIFNVRNTQQSCLQCKISKVNCTGEGPCGRCIKSKRHCTYVIVGAAFAYSEAPKSRDCVVGTMNEMCQKTEDFYKSNDFKPAPIRKKSSGIRKSSPSKKNPGSQVSSPRYDPIEESPFSPAPYDPLLESPFV